MGEKRFIISDASKLVDVESHVLRYWEDELDIEIPRNEMGHRYYTEFHINLLKHIKELKDSGYQLKAIKRLMPEIMELDESGDNLMELKKELFNKISKIDVMERESEFNQEDCVTEVTASVGHDIVKNEKMKQFQNLLNEAVNHALKQNSQDFGREVGDVVSDNVIKEMDYLMHIREKQEEERFKKLDETIRNYQINNRKNASEKKNGLFRRIKGFRIN